MIRYLVMTGLIIISLSAMSQSRKTLSIIPEPVSVKEGSGNFKLTNESAIEISSSALAGVGKYLAETLSPATGFSLKVSTVNSFSNGAIQLRLSGKPATNKEAYDLVVTPSSVTITADSAAGLFYGIQTLLQLLPNEIESRKKVEKIEWTIPALAAMLPPLLIWAAT